jgi:uncharacterized cupin superfamily protein
VEERAVGDDAIAAAFPAAQIQFNEVADGYYNDWHPAPNRLCFFVLSGEVELGTRDGATRLGSGDAALVEDTTGSGHTFRVTAPTVTAVIQLAG